MQSRRILITFNNNKYRTLDKTCIETREMLLRDKISLISISCVICFTKVGHLCWRLQRHRGFGRDRNKNAISVVFSSTDKVGTIFVPVSLRSTFLLLWRLVPLFDYLCTYVCMQLCLPERRESGLHLPTNRWKRVRYASRDYCFSLRLLIEVVWHGVFGNRRRWGKFTIAGNIINLLLGTWY